MNYYKGIERDALDYIDLQERQRRLLAELENENPSLFKRLMKAGLLAVLGAIGASIMDQDASKGALAGAAAGLFMPPRKRQMPGPVPQPPYRL